MDKVGRAMGLPFPAGKEVDDLAKQYNPDIHQNIPKFPLVLPSDSLDFSFSGLKSAAIREISTRKEIQDELSDDDRIEIAYGYQNTVTEILTHRITEGAKLHSVKTLCLVGGVSANSALRAKVQTF